MEQEERREGKLWSVCKINLKLLNKKELKLLENKYYPILKI